MAKDKSSKSDEAPTAEPRDRARDKELEAQLAVIDAVFNATHDDAGEPIPITVPSSEAEA